MVQHYGHCMDSISLQQRYLGQSYNFYTKYHTMENVFQKHTGKTKYVSETKTGAM